MAERVRDRVIKPLTVRRTRTDIESVPRYNKDVNGFPKVERPIESRYELNEHLADLFEQAMQTLTKKLTYARYQAIAYLKPEASNGLYDNAELISRSLAGIRKNGLVKRLESSFHAFQVSIENFKKANQNMINMFDNDKVFIAPDLDINMLFEYEFSEEEIEEKLNAKAENNPKNAIFGANDFRPEFIEMLRQDQEILEKWLQTGKKYRMMTTLSLRNFKSYLNTSSLRVNVTPNKNWLFSLNLLILWNIYNVV